MMIRRASEHDAEAIALVRVRAWQAAYGELMPGSFLAQLDATANLTHWREKLLYQGAKFSVIVAEHDETIVGFAVSGTPRYAGAPGAVELWSVNVDPSSWNSGFGSALVQRATTDARAYRYSRLELWCISGNTAARSLYAKCGFRETGRERTTSHLTGHPLTEVNYEFVF